MDLPILNVEESLMRGQRIELNEQTEEERIWDKVRRKWVALTPEEWVRQNVIDMICQQLGVSVGRIGNEIEIEVNGLKKRCDSIIFNDKGVALIIVEYKRTTVKITQKVFDQAAVYNMKLGVPYLIVSNGLNHYFCKVDREKGRYIFARDGAWPKITDL